MSTDQSSPSKGTNEELKVPEDPTVGTNNDSSTNEATSDGDRDSDGLRRRAAGGASNDQKDPVENGSPKKSPSKKKDKPSGGFGFLNGFKRHLLGEDTDDENEDAKSDQTITPKKEKKIPKTAMSFKGSPCHSWISNSSTNPYEGEFDEVEDDDDYFDGGDIDDYEYDPYTHEYVPRIRDPPEGEDSDDGLLVSREERNRSLSMIAQALLESARVNQEHNEKRKSQSSESGGGGGVPEGDGNNTFASSGPGVSILERFFDLCTGSNKLRKIEEMPLYLQFNKHIHSGYRELQDFWGCVFSLGYLHNESLNIITHVAPIIYIVLYWHSMFPWGEIIGNTFLNILGCAHIAASISPWIGSVIYHLFMSYEHDKGDRFYQILLQIDMFGIWITECFGALTNLSAASWCLPKNFQTGIMTAYGLAAVWGLQKALTAWTPVARRMCFAPVFISRILAFILRLSAWGGGNPDILIHVILQDVLSIAGGIIGVIRIPEKWFPGRLDMIFNSHHIMHILVVVAVCHMNMATNGDIRWIINNYSQEQCNVV